MINVEITERSIRLSGHACRKASDGIDRACAAVSALTCSLINSLQDLTRQSSSNGGKRNDSNQMGEFIRWRETSGRFMVPGTYRCQPGIQLHRISKINIREGVFIMSKT